MILAMTLFKLCYNLVHNCINKTKIILKSFTIRYENVNKNLRYYNKSLEC